MPTPLRFRSSLRQYAPPALFLICSYWVYGYRPIASLPWSAVDDGLYLRHAQAFVDWVGGRNALWLGRYDYFLLAKAPLYGIFLGLLNLACIPVRLGEFALLMGLPFVFANACRPLMMLRRWQFYVVACLLVWLPLLPSETHLLRNALQSILTSYLIIACVGLVLYAPAGGRRQIRWAMATGFFFSLCYLNREEAVWLGLVVFFSTMSFCVLLLLRDRTQWKRAVLAFATVWLCAAPLPLLVSTLNYSSYGVFLTTFRRSSSFVAAYQRMTSLEPELRKPYIPIRHETRLRAYAASPTFAKLQPFLEGTGSYWVAGNEGHSDFNGYSPADKEFFISNYEFALEYAAYCSGAVTARQADDLFAAIDRELGAAIRAGKLRAGRPGPATLAAVQKGDYLRIVTAWWKSFTSLLELKRANLDWSAQSSGEPAQLEKISLFVHSSLAPEPVDGLHYKIRRGLVEAINCVLRIAYFGTVPVLLAVLAYNLVKRRSTLLPKAIAVTIPVASLALSCLAMAVIDTLAFRFLDSMGYNVLGYSPLSVLCAFTAVLVFESVHSSDQGTLPVLI